MTARAVALPAAGREAQKALSHVVSALRSAGWEVVETGGISEAAGDPAEIVVSADAVQLSHLAAEAGRTRRLCTVVTASRRELVEDPGRALPEHVVAASRVIACPDETTRGLVETLVPGAAGLALVLTPDAQGQAAATDLRRRLRPDDGGLSRSGRPLRVVVAGHALHFLAAVIDHLDNSPDVELRIDHVRSFARQDEARSLELASWADVVLCEWCTPVAIWYSRHKRPGQRLLVRLHRYELYKEWPAQLDIAAVDQVICVSPHYAALTRQATGWPAAKVTVVPNYVDVAALARSKPPGQEYRLGLLGMVPRRKRPDIALDVVERLRARDPRYCLSVKTKWPWDDAWNRVNTEEVEYAQSIVRRVATSPVLLDGVSWEPHGPDVAAWMRGIGFVLSTSDDESFHLSPAEGMASGAVPVVLGWPGSDTIYDSRWIHRDTEEIVNWIDEVVRCGSWPALARAAQEQVRASFDVPVVTGLIRELLVRDLPETPSGATLSAAFPQSDLPWPELT